MAVVAGAGSGLGRAGVMAVTMTGPTHGRKRAVAATVGRAPPCEARGRDAFHDDRGWIAGREKA